MDGFELAELMRGSERTRHVPLIFVTAGSRDQHRMFQGYDTGAVDFLYKPIEPRILQNKADVFFQLHRQKQQLQQELRERTETLRLNEMFAAVLGHDLRTPLGAMLTAARSARSSTPTIRSCSEIAGRLQSSGKRMNRMIEDMLDLTRARLAGGIPITRAAGGPRRARRARGPGASGVEPRAPDRGRITRATWPANGTPIGSRRCSPTSSATPCSTARATSRCRFASTARAIAIGDACR